MQNLSNLFAGKEAVNFYGVGEAAELIKANIKRAERFVVRFLRRFPMVIKAADMAGHLGFGGSQAVMEAITIASKSAR
jgi:hypothetical protein